MKRLVWIIQINLQQVLGGNAVDIAIKNIIHNVSHFR